MLVSKCSWSIFVVACGKLILLTPFSIFLLSVRQICPAGSYCPDGTSFGTQYLCPNGTFGNFTGAACTLPLLPVLHWTCAILLALLVLVHHVLLDFIAFLEQIIPLPLIMSLAALVLQATTVWPVLPHPHLAQFRPTTLIEAESVCRHA